MKYLLAILRRFMTTQERNDRWLAKYGAGAGRTPMTPNKAAAEVTHKVLRKMAALELKTTTKGSRFPYEALWEELRIYLKGMAMRASAKKGGLGRK